MTPPGRPTAAFFCHGGLPVHPRTARPLRSAAAALSVAALALTAACSSSSSSSSAKAPADPTKPVTITVWTGQDVAPEKLLEGLAKQFHDAHPNVTIDISPGAPTTDELLQTLRRLRQRHLPGHLLRLRQLGQPAASCPAARSTSPTAGEGPGGEMGGVHRRQRGNRAAQRADVIGFPAVVDNLALMYNKTLFDKPRTWPTRRTAGPGTTSARRPRSSPTRPRTSTATATPSPAARTPPGTSGRCCGRTAAVS